MSILKMLICNSPIFLYNIFTGLQRNNQKFYKRNRWIFYDDHSGYR